MGRNMAKTLIRLALALATLGGPVCAQEDLTIFALGGIACNDWSRPANFANSGLKEWLLRYVSDVANTGSYRKNPLEGATPQQTFEWISRYCEAHPLTGLNVAGISFINEMSERLAGPN